jgi:hypothetical protein
MVEDLKDALGLAAREGVIEHGREMQQQDRGGEVTRADEEGRTATLCHLGEEPRGCREGGHQSRRSSLVDGALTTSVLGGLTTQARGRPGHPELDVPETDTAAAIRG